MDVQWMSNGCPMDVQWMSNGCPMDVQWMCAIALLPPAVERKRSQSDVSICGDLLFLFCVTASRSAHFLRRFNPSRQRPSQGALQPSNQALMASPSPKDLQP
jgi:hypothetical protein